MGTLVDILFPKTYLRFFIISNNLKDILIEFFNIFVLLSFSDPFAKAVYLFEGLRNTIS